MPSPATLHLSILQNMGSPESILPPLKLLNENEEALVHQAYEVAFQDCINNYDKFQIEYAAATAAAAKKKKKDVLCKGRFPNRSPRMPTMN